MSPPMKIPAIALLIVFAMTFLPRETRAEWQRVRAVQNVGVETSPVPGSLFKNIRGIVTIHAPLEDVVAVFDNRKTLKKWVHRLVMIKELEGNNKVFSLYLRFDMPMGIGDRDVVAQFRQEKDGTNRIIYEGNLRKGGAGQNGATAMKRFHSKWIFERKGAETLVTYEQFSDPGGLLPVLLVMPVAIDMVLNTLIKLIKIVAAQ